MPNLRALRLAAGLTQRQIGVAVGRSGSEVSEWERGRRSPRLPQIRALARVLGVPFETLIEQVEG